MNDKYLQYKLEDFLTDDSFVNWVLKDQSDQEWSQWFVSHPDQQEAILEAKAMVANLKFKSNDSDADLKKRIWSRIEKSTTAKEIPLKNNRRRLLYGLAAAASIALLCVYLIPRKTIIYDTDNAVAQVVTLPSNTIVKVEPSSRIAYKNNGWKKNRIVELEGFAHFNVSKGVPFRVTTHNGHVEVLGTEFDVVSKGNTFYVKVDEGKVNTSSGNRNEILTANMSFYKNPEWEGAYKLDKEWKTEQIFFVFKDQALSKVLKAIPFYFNMVIEQGSVNTDINYTGAFDTSEGLEIALQKVLWPLQIKFKISDNTVILSQ